MNLRLTSIGKTPPLKLKANKKTLSDPEAALTGARRVYFDGDWLDTNIYNRDALMAGNQIAGPAVVEETGSTTLVLPGDTALIDGYGNICMEISEP